MKHCFKILLFLFGLGATAIASVIPSNSENAPSHDPFVIYQWALWNSGQKVLNDIDDIHPKELTGSPQIQIGWRPTFDAQMKRDVVVAVIDSGLDTDHEDIQGHIAINTAECPDGHLPTGPTGDPDKNGFDGDCMGWNFTARNKKMGKIVDDDLGHGTHIAGIIAAVSGNGIGISGVSNRIKILPLKVYTASEENSVAGAPVQQQASISDRVAQALDYAVLRKVDVVNLSLGWPLVNNSEKVKTALKNALDHDILVVAGAGNDRHEAQIYPCAFEGVICVGSINIDGNVSRFSNFGGHVDVLAPGDNIVSLWPTALATSATVFGPKGYEILSGTSQATPYASGALAVLRGIYPHLSARDLRAKLLASAAPSSGGDTFTLRGLINLEKAISINTDALVLPSFKELDHLIVNAQTGEFTLPVRLNNYGHSLQNASIMVSSLNPQVSFPTATEAVSIAGSGFATLSIKGKVQSLKASAILRYQVLVNGQTFTHQILLSQDLLQNSRVQTYLFDDDAPTSALSSVKMMGNRSSVPEYFTVEKSASDAAKKSTTVKFYRLTKNGNQNQMVMAGAVTLANVSDLIGVSPVIKADLNNDGKGDYFISGLIQDKDGKVQGLQFGYFTADFQELFPGSSAVGLQYEDAILDGNTLRFVNVPLKDFGTIALPVFWTTGGVPKADRDPDPFNFEPITIQARRLYFYELERSGTGGVNFKTRIYDNYSLYRNLRRNLGIQVVEDLNLHTTMGQNLNDFSGSILRVMGSYGNGVVRQYFQLKVQGSQLLTHDSQILKMSVNNLDLQRQGFDDTLNYTTANGQVDVGTDVVGIFSVTSARTITFDDQAQSTKTLSNIEVQTVDPEEHLRGHIKTFLIDRQPISFFEGDTRLIAQGSYQNKPFHTENQIYRSSFLPGAYFTQRFYPVLVSNEGVSAKKPGLFVDNSKVFSATAEIWTLNDKNQLVAPLSMSYSLPDHCASMNPSRWSNQDVAVVLCQTGGKAQKLLFMGL